MRSGNFSVPPVTGTSFTRAGNLARNAVYGPGLHTWDTGMMKNFKLTERFTAQFSVDAFHLFNSPQWQNGSFNTAINVGSGTATLSPQGAQVRQFSERQLQFAFRLTF